MRSRLIPSALFAGGLLLATASAALADEPGAGLSVEPQEVTAGDTILLAGNGLEPDDERILVLQGEDVAVSLGTATTDGDGMLNAEIEIPGHLPSGTYQLQAIGDETLEIEVKVQAAEGGASEPAEEAPITARERGPIELGVILVGAALAAAVGGLLVWRAERLGGAHSA